MDIKEAVLLMRENEVTKWKTEEFELEITKESIARHHHEKHKKIIAEREKKDKNKKNVERDELKEFIYGKDKIERKEMGELYGV